MATSNDDLLKIQGFFRDSLIKGGWEEDYKDGSVIFRLDSQLIKIENQGHGRLDWFGYEDEHLETQPNYNPLIGYIGLAPEKLAIFRVSGTPEACKVIATTAHSAGEIYSGSMEKAFDILVAQTRSAVSIYGSRSGSRA